MKTNSSQPPLEGSRWNALGMFGCSLIFGVLLTLNSHAQVQNYPPLFESAPPAPPEVKSELLPVPSSAVLSNALRHRRVLLHKEMFRAVPPGESLRMLLPLFEDTEYFARVTSSASIGNSFQSWRGQLEGHVNGEFSAVYSSNALYMSISDGRGRDFAVQSTPDGGIQVIEHTPGLQGNCGEEFQAAPRPTPRQPTAGDAPPPNETTPNPPGSPYSHIDLLILYTTNARLAAGSTEAMHAKVWKFVNDSNKYYSKSGTRIVLRLAGLEETPYDDSSQNLTNHLHHLENLNDHEMDEVETRRNAWGADLVCLLVNGSANSDQTIGIAGGTHWASVVEWTQDTTVMAHEIGHNLGCHHEATEIIDYPSYSHGYKHTERWDVLGDTYRETRVTIMYSSFSNSTKTGFFSNPDIIWKFTGNNCGGSDSFCVDRDLPLGDAYSADNARFLREYRANTATNRLALFYVDPAAPVGGDATERQPETNLPLIFTGYIPAAEIRADQSPTIRLAPGRHPTALRVTRKSRLQKWGDAGGPARIGL